jgi:Holliday junction resolvasome RuvABC endonuclease subunit
MESIHTDKTILGIDPGTHFMGVAVIRGKQLLHYAVRTLRNGRKPYDLIGQARAHVLAAIRDFRPNLVAIEAPLLIPRKRAALVSAIAQELHERAKELGVRVVEIPPRVIREIIAGNLRANKVETAQAVIRLGVHELKPILPKPPIRPVLGPSSRDRYWLHVFDAVAVALCCQRTHLR